MTNCLNSVCMEINSLFSTESSYFFDGLYCTYLIICKHYAYKYCFRSDCFFNIRCAYSAVFVYGKVCYFISVFLEIFTCVKYSMMLDTSCYDMVSLIFKSSCYAFKHPVITLRAAACEKYFSRISIKCLCNLFSGLVYCLFAFSCDFIYA